MTSNGVTPITAKKAISPVKALTKPGKLSLEIITDPFFTNSLNRLIQLPFDATAAWWIGKATNRINSHNKAYHKLRLKTLEKYCELTKEGKIKFDEKDEAIFKAEDGRVKFESELEKLREEKVDVLLLSSSVILGLTDPSFKLTPDIVSNLDELFY